MTNMATQPPPLDAFAAVGRFPDPRAWLAKKSHFLFGPRQTGKTFLVRQRLPEARVYDLLDSEVFLTLSRQPGRLAEELAGGERIAVIDMRARTCSRRSWRKARRAMFRPSADSCTWPRWPMRRW